jgi:hypothetical protein
MICPSCFEHLDLKRHTMQAVMNHHIRDKDCLQALPVSTMDEKLHSIEVTLRRAQMMMEAIHPDFNSVPNAERFVVSCLKANEALRQMQRGNQETVDKYWGSE